MILKGEAYSKRLEKFTDDTMLLISKVMSLPREVVYQCLDIISDSELNEEEVVKRLKNLLADI